MRVDFSRRGLAEILEAIGQLPKLTELVVLSTCNRADIYAICEDADAVQRRAVADLHELVSRRGRSLNSRRIVYSPARWQ